MNHRKKLLHLTAILAFVAPWSSSLAESPSGFSGKNDVWRYVGVETTPRKKIDFGKEWNVLQYQAGPNVHADNSTNGGGLRFVIQERKNPSCRVTARSSYQFGRALSPIKSFFRQNDTIEVKLFAEIRATQACRYRVQIRATQNGDTRNVNCWNTRLWGQIKQRFPKDKKGIFKRRLAEVRKSNASVDIVRGKATDGAKVFFRFDDTQTYNRSHTHHRLGMLETDVAIGSQIIRFCHYFVGQSGSNKNTSRSSDTNVTQPAVLIGLSARNKTYRPGQSLSTPTGYRFVFQSDRNLVLYSPQGRALWATDCRHRKPDLLALQADGNVVLYAGRRAIWATNTNGRAKGGTFSVQNDGNLVVRARNGQVVWASGTNNNSVRDRQAARTWGGC